MIRYSLSCHQGHAFDAWFAGSDAYEQQNEAGLVPCPVCGSVEISKSLMTPSVSTSKRKQAQTPAAEPEKSVPVASQPALPPEALAQMRALREKVTANAEYVGADFAEEARKIHYGEREQAGIYGEAALDDVISLQEEGIDVLPLPVLPEDRN